MKKNKGFFSSLYKSTKVTLLSCISFIALTLLILVFFIFFPITPSERIMASIGRDYGGNTPASTSPVSANVSQSAATTTAYTTEEYTGSTTTKTYSIVITTGSGFNANGRQPTGSFGTQRIIVDDPIYPTYDPGYIYPVYTTAVIATEPYNPYTPVNTDTPVTDIPVYTEPYIPVDTETPPVYTEPYIPVVTETPPPVYTEPPAVITEPPAPPENNNQGGGEAIEEW